MAAQVAAVSGLLAAGAGIVRAQDAADEGRAREASMRPEGADAAAIADLLRVQPSSRGKCGCAPCWGPPAPPAMPCEAAASAEVTA
jgi:hypothetical protein